MLFVVGSLAVGGSETKIVRIANALARSGVSVGLAYLNPPETLLEKIDPSVAVTNLHRRGKYSFGALRRLRDPVARESDVVVAVNLYPLLYVIPAVKRWGSPSVRIAGLVNTSQAIGKERLMEPVYRPFLKRCDPVVFGSIAQQRLWVARYGLAADRSRVIYNGVDSEFFSPSSAPDEGERLRSQLGIPANAKIIGSVGAFRPEKSFDHLILALANLNDAGRDCYGLIAGQGAEKKRLQKAADAAGVSDKIKFCGLLDDVRAALSIMDVFVLPSTAVETFSNAALEAMAMGRPVVLSDIGGAAEMIVDGKSGMLFPAGDVRALTEILAALHDSREMRLALGSAARARVQQAYAFSDLVGQYRDLMNAGTGSASSVRN